MKKNLRLKWILILIVTGIAIYSVYPPKEKINLGLDLQGGMHLILEVDTEQAVKDELMRTKDELKRNLRQEHIKCNDILVDEDKRSLTFILEKEEEYQTAKDLIREATSFAVEDTYVNEQKSIEAILPAREANSLKENAVHQALETIRNRVDELQVKEPIIQRQLLTGDLAGSRILVQLPGVTDPQRAKRIIGETARLEWRLVKGQPQSTREALIEEFEGKVPEDCIILPSREKGPDNSEIRRYYMLEKESKVTGADLVDARVSGDEYGMPAVSFRLNPQGSRKFSKVTEENIGKPLAIVLDDVVRSAPVIRSKISNSGLISGSFSQQEAQDLSLILRAGSLPVPVHYLEERTVGPSLGRDSIQAGLKAGILGSILVVAFMIVYYKFSGLIANIALVLNIVLLMGFLAFFGATLTLPGIAGIVLTIGMAVDANILIYERIKEELRTGKTIRAAVDSGFSKALLTILDSNITTIIAAVVLFQFGTGPVKGFAVTLTLGIICNLFTALTVTRAIFDSILLNRNLKKLSI